LNVAVVRLAEGELIGGKYRLERVLGEGGMGSVWAATHALTRMRVAVKFLKPEYSMKEEVAHRFLREARAAAAVRHPNVVSIHDVMQLEDGTAAMVMDYLKGESLGERIHRVGAQPPDVVARILLPVVSAVGTAHSLGIVHRDLKPDNLFLAEENDLVTMKVLDFGIAKLTATEGEAASTGALTRTGSVLGTPYYMSPEQAFGERDLDHRSDIWSLGVIFWECLTGKRPTEGENLGQVFKIIATAVIPPPSSVVPSIPPDIDALVVRMLQKERNDRPQSLNDVRVVLERYAGQSMPSIPLPIARLALSGPGTGPGISAPSSPGRGSTKNLDERSKKQLEDARTVSAMNISSVAPPPPLNKSRVPLLVGGLLAVACVGAVGGVVLKQLSSASKTATMAATQEPTAAPLISSSAQPSLAASSVPSATSAAITPSASASASASPQSVPDSAQKPLARTPVSARTNPSATPAASSTNTGTGASPPATASSGRGPGGLVSQTPF
jgi:serine/threonine protein kinase